MSEEGFSDNPFMMGYDNNIFEEDLELGFRFPKRKLVGSKGFVKLKDVIRSICSGDKVVINIGDSSTTGWNSNKIYRGNKDPDAAFFTYKTYSQLLEEQSELVVVNAGVTGYTSLQGRKYLEILMKEFARKNISVDYVTIYLGNNDPVYNKYEDKVRLDRK